MSHVPHMNESRHTYKWVMSHIWMSHVTHMNESCPTYEWVTSHIWKSHVPHMNVTPYGWWILWMSHITHIIHMLSSIWEGVTPSLMDDDSYGWVLLSSHADNDIWIRPTLWIMLKYLRAGPSKMPFRSWYNYGTNHFHQADFCLAEMKKPTMLSNKGSTAWSCAENQIFDNKILGTGF